ncbi:hypothetical protein WKI68_08015 [Streptomyces sp. MS1.HAVA.3]|uniref:Uncharacterized protein n=1 Tax=Streptomyces caledonius TaxID=3134107 RepID=A0ABU8U0N7_9ACTN
MVEQRVRVGRRRSGGGGDVRGEPAVARAGSWTVTAASRTEGWRVSASSISPGSTRKPRIFTWSSIRPVISSTPSAVRWPRSPVR